MIVTLYGVTVTDRTTISMALKADLMRSDLDQGLIWFVNYAALDPTSVKSSDLDLHGAAMMPEDVEKFAHRWLAFSRSVDIEHDGVGRPVHVIESFFNGSDVAAPAWPINSHAVRFDVSQSNEAMEGLRSGVLNSVSLDAFTFNKVVRLPAAQAKTALGIKDEFDPAALTDLQWAEEISKMGYEGVTSVREAAPGLYVAERSCGMPVAVSIKDGLIEASAAGGAWSHVGAMLMESGSLVNSQKLLGPDYPMKPGGGSQPVDYGAWDSDAVVEMLESTGVIIDPERDTFEELTAGAYAGIDYTTQTAFLPHHKMDEGKPIAVSKAGVLQAIGNISKIPEQFRASVREHLLSHLNEILQSETA